MNARVLAAEFLGTALLVATVVGSGVMAARLADGNVALALLGNGRITRRPAPQNRGTCRNRIRHHHPSHVR